MFDNTWHEGTRTTTTTAPTMAVIEEDYDDGASSTSHENIDAVRAKEEPRTPSTSTPLDRLLRGKQKLVER